MAINTRLITTMSMGGADYTLSGHEAMAGALVVLDAGDGTKTITIPTAQDGITPAVYGISTAYAGNTFYMQSESGGGSTLINAPEFDMVGYAFGSAPVSLYAGFINNDAFGAGWNGSLKAPTQNAVYDQMILQVPYTGATGDVDLGAHNLSTTGILACGGTNDAMVINGVTIASQLAVNSDSRCVIEAHSHTDTVANGAIHYSARSRGTNASPAVVQSGDYLGTIGAVGYDGTDYAIGARIDFIVDGVAGSNDMPTRMEFSTSADGSQTPTLRLTISSTGKATFTDTLDAATLGGNIQGQVLAIRNCMAMS
jgi:hypothetical protein